MDSGIALHYLKKVLTALERLSSSAHSYLNLNKLAIALSLSPVEMGELVEFILQLQKFFSAIPPRMRLSKVRKNNAWYLTFNPQTESLDCTELQLSIADCNALNDLIHYFKHVSKGKGFDIRFPSTNFLLKIKKLKKVHPYFFESRGNGLFYPTSLALSLGDVLERYNRTNRTVSTIFCENHKVIIN
jgi:hypothetical protein